MGAYLALSGTGAGGLGGFGAHQPLASVPKRLAANLPSRAGFLTVSASIHIKDSRAVHRIPYRDLIKAPSWSLVRGNVSKAYQKYSITTVPTQKYS